MNGKRHGNGENNTVSLSQLKFVHVFIHVVFLGDLVSVDIFGSLYIFINSHKAAADLLEKRGNIFSQRPSNTMLQL